MPDDRTDNTELHPSERMSIASLFSSRQEVLKNKLQILLSHPVTKGDHCESAWIDFFRSFLPSKYAVDKGFVFDALGDVSEQIDVIIYDALYAPLIFGTDAGEKFITAESVYAVFESKQKINKGTLEYADHKIQSVCGLKRSSRGMIIGGQQTPSRSLTKILGGILSVDAISPKAIEEYMPANPHVNFGCAINKTTFAVFRDGTGCIEKVSFSSREETVLSFFYLVLDELYKLGTVGAVDIRDYADASLGSIKLERRES